MVATQDFRNVEPQQESVHCSRHLARRKHSGFPDVSAFKVQRRCNSSCPNLSSDIWKRIVFIGIPLSQRLPGNSGCAVLHAGGHFWIIFTLSLIYEGKTRSSALSQS